MLVPCRKLMPSFFVVVTLIQALLIASKAQFDNETFASFNETLNTTDSLPFTTIDLTQKSTTTHKSLNDRLSFVKKNQDI